MPTIDDKVVAMSFESSKFESGVNSAIAALEKLKSSLKFPTAGKGLEDIGNAAKRVDLSHIANSLDTIKGKFSALSVAGLAVIANLATKAVSAGAKFVSALTIDPAKAGFSEYTTNLNAVQTILANTQASGAKLSDVNAALKQLNDYSDKTIYNFSQMAKNIGTFTAAGVDLKTATGAIKGIANLAALSGSNSEQASTAMYQLSQAISAGRVSLQDWNSVVNAGMGGTVFQRALAQTAVAMGKLDEKSVQLKGSMKNVSIEGESFRQSISAAPGKQSWLTSDVLTNTLKQFTGDLSNAQLKAQGFNDAQIKAIQQTATTAMHAATEVKTLQGVLDTARETAGSGWAQTWQIIFGDFGEAKVLFTNVSNAVNGFIKSSADARNKVLGDWKALGGRTVLINSIKTAFHNLGLIIQPIKEAFRDIFPARTGRDLFNLTLRFKDFANALKPSEETVNNLKRTFRGLFALLDIGKQIISGIFTVFGQLFGAISDGDGGFLKFTGNIGDFLVSIDKALKEGDRLHNFFVGLGRILAAPIRLLKTLAEALSNLFGGFSSGGFSSQMDGMTKAMTPFQKVMAAITKAWDSFVQSLSGGSDVMQSSVDAIIQLITGLGKAIGDAASNMNFEAILAVIRTGLFGGLVLMFKSFLGKGTLADQLGGLGGGILKNIAGSFGALEGSMKAMQQNLKAKTLKEIAIAIGILAASILALSFVDPERLKSSLTAITVGFGQLLGAMAILDKIGKAGGFLKMPFIAGSMILLAGAIDILAIAVLALSRLSWDELVKGLTGVSVLLGAVAAASIPLSKNSAGMIRAGIGLIALAVALKILASAVADFGGMSWSELGKGLAGVAGGLVIMAGAMQAMPKGLILQGAGLIAVAFGLKLLAGAVAKFAGMDLRTTGRGLLGIAGALVIIAGAMHLMPKNMPLTAAGLLLVSVSLGKIVDAVAKMGGMSIKQLAKGLVGLGGALVILAAALYAMSGTFGGAAALGVAAAGLAMLTPALIAMGKMSWEEILKGLFTLGAALTLLGVAGALLTPVVPTLLGLGAALLLLGAGLALAGAGVFLIGAGLSAIAVSGATAIGILVAGFGQLVKAVVDNAKLIVLGVLEIVNAFADSAPKFVDAMIKILGAIVDAIIKASPKIAQAFNALIALALKVIADNQDKIIQAGFNLMIALLQGIKNNIPKLVTLAVDIIVKFLNAITNNISRVITAGTNVLLAFIKGIANNIAKVGTTAVEIIAKFISEISRGLSKIIAAGTDLIVKFIKGISDAYSDVIKAGTNAIVKFINGVENAAEKIVSAGRKAAGKFIKAIAAEIPKLAQDVYTAVINLMNNLAAVINNNTGPLRAAGMNLGFAIINGMTFGLASKAQGLYNTISGIVGKAKSLFHIPFKVRSPSQVTRDLGENIILGLVKGLDENAPAAYESAETVSKGVIQAVKDIFQIASPSKVMYELGKDVGTGFAQGIRGSSEDIRNAFADMNEKLTDAMRDARETIAEEQKKLDELRKEKKPDKQAIREAQAVIKENEDILARSVAGHIALTKTLKDEKAELIGLTGDYERISNRLEKAQTKLAEIQKTRADAIKSFTEKYATLPEIVTEDAEGNAIDQLGTYMEAITNQANAVNVYRDTLQQLRKLGLDDATYQKLLSEGTADQQFASQLLAGGKTAVQALNGLDGDLKRVSEELATNAGDNLYKAGVNSAKKLVKGLTSQKSALGKAMEELAHEMITTLKRELKIKSPSRVFAEIAEFAMAGMAKGFTDSTKVVNDAVENAAEEALTVMEKSMRNMSDVVANELNPNPVITPILDLTQVQAKSKELAALTNVSPITAAASFGQASAISSESAASQAEQLAAAQIRPSLVFEQNNYSPEALSEIEIYRQTKNQLSQIKSALAIT